MCVKIYVNMCEYAYVYMYVYVCMYVCMCMCVYVCVCAALRLMPQSLRMERDVLRCLDKSVPP